MIFTWEDTDAEQNGRVVSMPLFEDPYRREIFDEQYRYRRGSWDIAEVPDFDGPLEYPATREEWWVLYGGG